MLIFYHFKDIIIIIINHHYSLVENLWFSLFLPTPVWINAFARSVHLRPRVQNLVSKN